MNTLAHAGPKGLLRWTEQLEAATQAPKAHAAAHAVARLLQRVAALRDQARTDPHLGALLAHAVARLAALAPLLALVQGALQQQALRWACLHRACAKLAYISAAIFGTLMEEGFCGPQDEGQATEGGWAHTYLALVGMAGNSCRYVG